MSTHPEIMYAERSSADEPEKVGDGAVIDLAECPSRMMRPASWSARGRHHGERVQGINLGID